MVKKRFIPRPSPSLAVQWTGDNVSELEEHGASAEWIVVDNGSTASIYMEEGDPPSQVLQFTMALNEWTGLTASGHCSDEFAKNNYQEVPDEDPVAYVTKKDPS